MGPAETVAFAEDFLKKLGNSCDIDIVVALARSAIAELRPLRGGAIWAELDARAEPLDDALAAEIAAATHVVIVGTIDDTVVGYAAAHERSLHRGDAIARITDLYVMPDARGVGVGEQLLLAVEAWARGRGHSGLDSLALPGDRNTKNFFESFGLVARAIEVHRSLDS